MLINYYVTCACMYACFNRTVAQLEGVGGASHTFIVSVCKVQRERETLSIILICS